jgi:RNase H-fold protein (predicted Holliday junction resolvase)
VANNMRILGIDYGAKRVGLAISSPVGFMTQGLPTI